MFSSRLPQRLHANRVTLAVAAARGSRRTLLDLTETNPTVVGLPRPDEWGAIFDDPAVGRYHPEPFGLAAARELIAREEGGGRLIRPEHVVLSASTSEAYSLLFKLLADAGDEVSVPRPSYPLFDMLTRLDEVRTVSYRLDPAGAWGLDRASLEDSLTTRTRAVLVVSPNNPTGSMLRRSDREWLVELAAARDLAIIADEVFAPYPLAAPSDAASFMGEDRALVFTLGGLSKSAGLPQMKLAWTIASGPPALLHEALSRLDLIADTYLSASTPVQVALPRLIDAGRTRRAAIAGRLRQNLETLRGVGRDAPWLTLGEPHGGWSAVLRVPAIGAEEDLVIRLIEAESVLVHPGYFFDFDEEAYLVVSLLPRPEIFEEAVRRVARLCHTGAAA